MKVEFQEKKTWRRFVYRVFLGSALRFTTWESESSTNRGRIQAAMQLVPCELMRPFRVNSNYGKEASA